MDNRKILEIAKSYSIKRKATFIITAIITIAILVFLPIEIQYRTAVASLPIIICIIINKRLNYQINKILYTDCDPQLYYLVCKAIYKGRESINLDLLVAQFIGDYQKAISCCALAFDEAKNKSLKAYYLELMAKCAFEGGDFQLCLDTTNRLTELVNSAESKKKSYNRYINRCKFYESFISCDYESALVYLEKCMSVPKQMNSYKATMQYYKGLALYYSGKSESAREAFCKAAEYDKLKIADFSKEYINCIDEGIIKTLSQSTFSTEYEKSNIPAKIKMPLWKKLLLIVLVGMTVFFLIQLYNEDKGSLPEALSAGDNSYTVAEVIKQLDVDEEYSLCIFTTTDEQIGISYLKQIGDNKYKAPVSYVDTPYSYINDDLKYYIYQSGFNSAVSFDITDDKGNIPNGMSCEPISALGKTYYFIYSIDEKEYHMLNSTGCYLSDN